MKKEKTFRLPEEVTVSATGLCAAYVRFDGYVVNRVPVRGTLHYVLRDGDVLPKGKLWETLLYRADQGLTEVPTNTKAAAIEHGREFVRAWAATDAGAYALVRAEAEARTYDYERALRDIADAEEAVRKAKSIAKQAKAAMSRATSARTKFWRRQHQGEPA